VLDVPADIPDAFFLLFDRMASMSGAFASCGGGGGGMGSGMLGAFDPKHMIVTSFVD
jgi:hypothetical protein